MNFRFRFLSIGNKYTIHSNNRCTIWVNSYNNNTASNFIEFYLWNYMNSKLFNNDV